MTTVPQVWHDCIIELPKLIERAASALLVFSALFVGCLQVSHPLLMRTIRTWIADAGCRYALCADSGMNEESRTFLLFSESKTWVRKGRSDNTSKNFLKILKKKKTSGFPGGTPVCIAWQECAMWGSSCLMQPCDASEETARSCLFDVFCCFIWMLGFLY